MKRWSAVVIVGAALVLIGAAAKERPTGVFGPLKKGQTVTLKEAAGRYQIGIVPGVEGGHKPWLLIHQACAGQ